MKTIIAGSRTILDYPTVERAILSAPFVSRITTVFSGMASGVDILGFRWATGKKIPIRRFVPEWDKLGKQAGFIRNAEMATFADAAIVVWDGRSGGTKQLLAYMKKLDPKVELHLTIVKPENDLVSYAREHQYLPNLGFTSPSPALVKAPDSSSSPSTSPTNPPSLPASASSPTALTPAPQVSPPTASSPDSTPSPTAGC